MGNSRLLLSGAMLIGLVLTGLAAEAADEAETFSNPILPMPIISEFSGVVAEDAGTNLQAFHDALNLYNKAAAAGDYNKALLHGTLALQIGEQISTVPSKDLANLAVNLARIRSIQRDFVRAYDLYDRALDHFTKAYGSNSAHHYAALRELVSLAVRRGHMDRAKPRFEELQHVVKAHFDYPCKERGRFYLVEARFTRLQLLGSTISSSSSMRLKKLKRSLEDALDDFEAIGDHLGVGDSLFERAKLDMELDQLGRAKKRLLNALDAYAEAGLAPGDTRVLVCHTFLAQNYLRNGQEAEATPHLQYISQHQGDIDRDNVQPLYRVAPTYPANAARRGTEGWVLFEFIISIEGKVKGPVVIDSDPLDVFDEAGTKAILKWRYVPLSKDGILIESKTRVVLTFKLVK